MSKFDESKIKRDGDGKFSSKGGGGGSAGKGSKLETPEQKEARLIEIQEEFDRGEIEVLKMFAKERREESKKKMKKKGGSGSKPKKDKPKKEKLTGKKRALAKKAASRMLDYYGGKKDFQKMYGRENLDIFEEAEKRIKKNSLDIFYKNQIDLGKQRYGSGKN